MDPGSLLLVAVFAVVMFSIFNRGRRQQREAQALQSRLAPGAHVMTSSGLHATVVELPDDGTAVLETWPGQRSRWDRRAIARVVDTETAVPGEPIEPGVAAAESTAPPTTAPEVGSPEAGAPAPRIGPSGSTVASGAVASGAVIPGTAAPETPGAAASDPRTPDAAPSRRTGTASSDRD